MKTKIELTQIHAVYASKETVPTLPVGEQNVRQAPNEIEILKEIVSRLERDIAELRRFINEVLD